jgi:hypothetical protein
MSAYNFYEKQSNRITGIHSLLFAGTPIGLKNGRWGIIKNVIIIIINNTDILIL